MQLYLLYLTLTSVVFEYGIRNFWCHFYFNLTLTSVVFESVKSICWLIRDKFNFNKCCIWIEELFYHFRQKHQFNFNKCCIWILVHEGLFSDLLVFNFNKCCIWMIEKNKNKDISLSFNFNKCCIWIVFCIIHFAPSLNLTLTSVVFEYPAYRQANIGYLHLTLTSVVFELFCCRLWYIPIGI